jgi:hypothetical protein
MDAIPKKMKVPIINLACATLILFILSCTDSSPEPVINNGGGKEEIKEPIFNRGEDSIVFTAYKPLENRPVTIHYYIPKKGDITEMDILFSMHGAERDGTIQRNAWKHFAEHYGFIVLAPQFSREHYKENDYQFGSIFTDRDSEILNPKEKWTYQLIEAIFDYFKEDTGNTSERYDMFGHSAGGQFVHRYLIATPNARVRKAVAANPGSWTLPYKDGITGTDNKSYGWPYAIKGSPFTSDEHIRRFFEKRLYVQLGTADTNENDSNLPKDPPSMAQGKHRYERGEFFYEESRNIATEMNTTFNFRFMRVINVGHSTLRMVYGKSTPFDSRNIEDVGANCAFDLIYRDN